MSELSHAIGLCKSFTDELDKLGFNYRVQVRKGNKYMDLKTDGFKEMNKPKDD
jgi:hypothetical protein